MRYECVIFDLDGVICSTDRFHYLAWKKVAEQLHIPFDESVNQRLRGVGRMESFDIILENYQGEMSQEDKIYWTERKNDLYREYLKSMSDKDVLPGVRTTIDGLRGMGLKLALGSSSRNARFILDRLQLGDCFGAVIDGNDIARSKPDPEVFTKAALSLEVDPSDSLVVEDAKAGLQAALSGGMDCAAVGSSAVSSGLATWNLADITDLLHVVR